MSETAESLQERIEAKFSPETDVSEDVEQEQPGAETAEEPTESSEESAEQEEASAAFEEVEYEGRKYQVPPELKEALMAQKDYTAKTTETARLRDALSLQQKEVILHQEQRAFEQSVAEDYDRLKMIDSYLQHLEKSDWSELDATQKMDRVAEITQLGYQRSELAKALEGKRSEFAEKLKEQRKKIKTEADEVLSKAIPNYGPEIKSDIEKFVVERGYPQEAIEHMSALDYQIAWEASQFRKLQQGKAAAVKKAANAPPVIKPGASNPMPQDVRDKLKFKKDLDRAKKENLPEAQKARLIQRRLEQKFGG